MSTNEERRAAALAPFQGVIKKTFPWGTTLTLSTTQAPPNPLFHKDN